MDYRTRDITAWDFFLSELDFPTRARRRDDILIECSMSILRSVQSSHSRRENAFFFQMCDQNECPSRQAKRLEKRSQGTHEPSQNRYTLTVIQLLPDFTYSDTSNSAGFRLP